MELKGTRKAFALGSVLAMLLVWLAVEVATTGAGQAGAAGTSGTEVRRATRITALDRRLCTTSIQGR